MTDDTKRRLAVDDLPIPEDVQPDDTWTQQMLDLAYYLGPYLTLCVIEQWGGQTVYIAADPERNPFRDVIGPELADTISKTYRREHLSLPTGKVALRKAKRANIIQAAREGNLTVTAAAKMIGSSRTYVSALVNERPEGGEPPRLGPRKIPQDPNQMDLFGDE